MEKESFARPWDWEAPHDTKAWLTPAKEVFYLAYRWKDKPRFLDFGCGLGRHSLFFAKNGHEVLGFDLSEVSVSKTKALLKEHGIPGNYVVSDMHHVALPDGCCDCLLAYHVASHTTREGLPKVVGEIYRLLSKGGECFLDFCSEDCWIATESGYPKLDDITFVPDKGEEEGIPHCCPSLDLIQELFKDFAELNVEKIDAAIQRGERKNARHYWILAKK